MLLCQNYVPLSALGGIQINKPMENVIGREDEKILLAHIEQSGEPGLIAVYVYQYL